MKTTMAMLMGQANQGKERMVFDWCKAARPIAETGATRASAGLRDDWEYTGGVIFSDGKPVDKNDTYTYLASTWATPEIEIDGDVSPCFLMESETPGWDADTYWPQEALEIYNQSIASTN